MTTRTIISLTSLVLMGYALMYIGARPIIEDVQQATDAYCEHLYMIPTPEAREELAERCNIHETGERINRVKQGY